MPPPKQLPLTPNTSTVDCSLNFPVFDAALFEVDGSTVAEQSPWRRPNNKAALLAAELDKARRLQNIASPRKKQRRRHGSKEPQQQQQQQQQADREQQNYTFVKQLLKETKVKTNRLLLMKMGKEALHLGHHDSAAVQGVEENTLVAGFCDLLDRIWANDLKKRPLANSEQGWPAGEEKKVRSFPFELVEHPLTTVTTVGGS